MPWKAPYPRDDWTNKEKGNFSREIWVRLRFGSVTFTPLLLAPAAAQTFLIAQSGGDVTSSAAVGLRAGQAVTVTWPSAPATGLVVDAWCDANDTLKIRFQNFGAGNATPPAGAYAFKGMVL